MAWYSHLKAKKKLFFAPNWAFSLELLERIFEISSSMILLPADKMKHLSSVYGVLKTIHVDRCGIESITYRWEFEMVKIKIRYVIQVSRSVVAGDHENIIILITMDLLTVFPQSGSSLAITVHE